MIYSIGHSTLSAGDFLTAASPASVIIDVRSHPTSRWEQFRKESMEVWLPDGGIGYEWWPSLGGWTASHMAYAETMASHGVDVACYSRGKFPKQRIAQVNKTVGAGIDPRCPLHDCSSRIKSDIRPGTRPGQAKKPNRSRLSSNVHSRRRGYDQSEEKRSSVPHSIYKMECLPHSVKDTSSDLQLDLLYSSPFVSSPRSASGCGSEPSQSHGIRNKEDHDLSVLENISNILVRGERPSSSDFGNDTIDKSSDLASFSLSDTGRISGLDPSAQSLLDADSASSPGISSAGVVRCTCGTVGLPFEDGTNRPIWTSTGLRDYSFFMSIPEFLGGADELIRRGAREDVAIMCCECQHWRCHRSMVSDYLAYKGVDVHHLMPRFRQKDRVKYLAGSSSTPHSKGLGNRLERYEDYVLRAWGERRP